MRIRISNQGEPSRIESFDHKSEIKIGRVASNDLVLAERGISSNHARLNIDPSGQLFITDLGSTNGTFVNGRRIQGSQPITLYDEVYVCHIKIEVAIGNQSFPPEAPPDPVQTGRTQMASAEQVEMLRRSRAGGTLSGEIGGGSSSAAEQSGWGQQQPPTPDPGHGHGHGHGHGQWNQQPPAQPGYDQGQWNQPGPDQGHWNQQQGGAAQPYDPSQWNQQGYGQQQQGYEQPGYDPGQWNQQQQHAAQPGYDQGQWNQQQGYAQQGYEQAGYGQPGYGQQQGYPEQAYAEEIEEVDAVEEVEELEPEFEPEPEPEPAPVVARKATRANPPRPSGGPPPSEPTFSGSASFDAGPPSFDAGPPRFDATPAPSGPPRFDATPA
ncbi:MAG TPA: FHA domain-containing protein, partial [Enhygromyxa sp.]|nr:FHA domain-containing protein [Enhygromyxa sp.]